MPASKMGTDSDIVAREEGFWTGSVEYYERWLARDVLMVFPAPAGILKRDDVLAGIRSGTRWRSITMADISVRRIGKSVVVLVYRACATKQDSTSAYTAFVASVYRLEEDDWKLAFHQHTPVQDREMPAQ